MPVGDGSGAIALEVNQTPGLEWQLLSRAGARIGSVGAWQGEIFPQSSGYFVEEGSSGGPNASPSYVGVTQSGAETGRLQTYERPIPLAGPNGRLLLVGPLSLATDTPQRQTAMLLDEGARVLWGPRALGLQSNVFGGGLDLQGRALVIQDGSSTFGSDSIAAQWFDLDGTPMGDPFELIGNFSPGKSTWFETSPLIGGGLAVRRMDITFDSSGISNGVASEWLAVLTSGSSQPDKVPSWLQSRPNTSLHLVRSVTAYATTPWGADVGACAQQVEVLSPAGNSCGSLALSIDSASCRTRDLRMGLDGTLLQMLPFDHEHQIGTTDGRTCTLRFWPGALH